MKKLSVAFAFICLLLLHAPVFSMGFGFYGTGGYGKVDMMRIIDHGNDYRVMYSREHSLYGGGLILESGKESDGYHDRLNFGVEGSTSMGGRYEFRRLMRAKIDNVFAFRIAGNEQVRFWIGPLLGIQLLTGLSETTRNEQWGSDKLKYHLAALAVSSMLFPYGMPYGLNYVYFEKVWKRTYGVFIPIGLALGVNIRLGENAALTVEGGFRCGFYYLRNGGFNYEGYGTAGFIFGAI